MHRPEEFRGTVRRGERCGRRTIVGHLRVPHANCAQPDDAQPKVGFIVSRKVGNAVVRNRVKRRLRELLRASLGELPAGSNVVIRALPAAATANFETLRVDVRRVLGTLIRAAQITP